MGNCKYCGRQLNGESFCPGCGSPVTPDQNVNQPMTSQQYPNQPMYNQQNPNQQYPNQQQMYNQPGANPNGTQTGLPKDNNAIIGFICGLVGFFCCSIAGIPGLICSILSQQDIKAGKVDPGNKTFGTIGLVLNIISLAWWVINIILNLTTSSGYTSLTGIIDLFGLFS